MKDLNAIPFLLSALGAVCIHLMLPTGRPRRNPAILFTGIASLAGLLILFGAGVGSPMQLAAKDWLYVAFGASAVVSGALLITQERPVYAALWFVMVILSVAGLLLMLGAQFTAAVMVVIYAGAILVTYLFVIMLAVKAGMPEHDTRSHRPAFACLVGFLLMAGFWMANPPGLYEAPPTAPPPATAADAEGAALRVRTEYVAEHTESLGLQVFTRHVVALEAAGIVLMVALAGSVVMAQRRIT